MNKVGEKYTEREEWERDYDRYYLFSLMVYINLSR